MDRSRWKWASKPSPTSSGSTGPHLSWRNKKASDANLSRRSLYLFFEAPDSSCLDSLFFPKETLRRVPWHSRRVWPTSWQAYHRTSRHLLWLWLRDCLERLLGFSPPLVLDLLEAKAWCFA
ncbi:hypothetical protein ElyMa_000254900 [Elysia marginata]|uniref:Uncharacterized protein n=1 Tax=Elysia marginata TaxID=1093978 RepID=A0AAV4F3G0_9GAST|nr:hypothetical protein ElyMa_000254900 [Elysia marginata]